MGQALQAQGRVDPGKLLRTGARWRAVAVRSPAGSRAASSARERRRPLAGWWSAPGRSSIPCPPPPGPRPSPPRPAA